MLNINFRSPKTKKVIIILVVIFVVLLGLILGIILNAKNQKPVEKVDYTSQGQTALSKFQYTTAAQLFQKAIVQDSTDTLAYVNLAKIYSLKNNYELAIQTLEQGIANNNYNKQLLVDLIADYKKTGNSGKVEEMSKQLLNLLSKDNSEKLDIAEYILNVFNIEKHSNFEQAKINLSKYQIDFSGKLNGENSEQINFLLALLEWKDQAVSKQYLSSVSSNSIKIKSDYLNSILDRYKDDVDEVSLNIARLMINEELAAPALNIANEIISNNSEYFGSYLIKGTAEFQLEKYDEAKSDLIKSYQLGANPLAQVYLAKIYEKQNLTQQSSDAYEKALQIDSKNLEIYKNYAEMLYRTNLFAQSVSIYQKLIDKSEHNSMTFENYLRLCEILFYKSNNIQTLYDSADKLLRFWSDVDNFKANEGLLTFYRNWAEYQLNILKPENAQSVSFHTSFYKSLVALDSQYPNSAIINYHIGLVLKTLIKFLPEQTDIDYFSKLERSYLEKSIELDTSGNFASKAQDIIKTLN